MGKTQVMFRWGMIATGITVAGFIIGLHWGIMGVATSYAIVMLLTLIPTFALPFRLIRLRVLDLWIALWPITRAATAMGVATMAFRRLVMASMPLPPVVALLVFVPFGAAIYFALMYWWNKPMLVEFFGLARSGLGILGGGRRRGANAAGGAGES
jgi:PST family polysaccharide transporter